MIRRKRVLGLLFPALAAAAPALTGCGRPAGGSAQSTTSTTESHQSLAQRYTKLVADGDHRLQQLSRQLNSANGNVVAIELGFREVSSTYRGVATSVQHMRFPLSMRTDVAAMVVSLKNLAADAAQGAHSVTLSEFNLVFSELAAHQKIEVAANTKVNHDLGISSIS